MPLATILVGTIDRRLIPPGEFQLQMDWGFSCKTLIVILQEITLSL